ncbi:MAG: VCBS repeat-containing protein [Verrucomicrobia bacterium]|nr:VCBS repeat-containing protein [Verrucomicrobiota bacterium]
MVDAASAPLSPRRRRVRLTMTVLSVVTLLGTALGALIYFKTRPVAYRPDEQSADITSDLARNLPPETPKPRFTDVTRAAGLGEFRNFTGARTGEMPEDIGPGLAWADFDNDGDDDLFLVSAGGALNVPENQLQPCALFENLGDGTFRRTAAFPDTRIHGNGAAWADYDGDGFLDLVVSGFNALLLFHNEAAEGGGRKFVRDPRLPNPPGFWTGVSWGDYDNDRAPDLYVCGYISYVVSDEDRQKTSQQVGSMVPFTLNPASFNGGTNMLFHNNRDGTFTDVAPALKVTNPEGRSLGALWHDFDEDGWLDLYVANDISDNVFFHNLGGKFEDISHPALVADYRSAMGLAVGDYNRDGDDDMFVSHWVAQENALYDNTWADFNLKPGARLSSAAAAPNATNAVRSQHGSFPLTPALSPGERENRSPGIGESGVARRAGASGVGENRKASLPLPEGEGRGEGEQDARAAVASGPPSASIGNRQSEIANPKYPLRFMDIADQKGLGQIALPYVGWGTEFVDFDGDGWLDLVVANGSTLEEDGPAPKKLKPQDTLLFWNRRGEYFHNIAPLHAGLSEKHVSRGLAVADFDHDGDMDFIIADLGEGVRLFRNDMQTGHWLKIRLRSRNHFGKPLGFGDGSKVIAHVGAVALRRSVTSVSYLSQGSRTLHFGLGAATKVDRLEVRWHAGETNFFEGLDTDASYEITEGEATVKRWSAALPRRSASQSGNTLNTSIAPTPPQPAAAQESRAPTTTDKQRTLDFWNKQRAAMNAMKIEKDNAKAIPLFREALALNPAHEDSLYYLASCLAGQGDTDGALAQLAELKRLNSQSQRAFAQWGTLRAMSAKSPVDLQAAEESLARAHAINPEETGALLVLGEVALLRGETKLADERLAAACRTNPKAVGGFFLRGYLAWKRGDDASAKKLLEETRTALGKEWQPKGATSEGDVKQKQHVEKTPLTHFWESWDGSTEPARSFGTLDSFLNSALHP